MRWDAPLDNSQYTQLALVGLRPTTTDSMHDRPEMRWSTLRARSAPRVPIIRHTITNPGHPTPLPGLALAALLTTTNIAHFRIGLLQRPLFFSTASLPVVIAARPRPRRRRNFPCPRSKASWQVSPCSPCIVLCFGWYFNMMLMFKRRVPPDPDRLFSTAARAQGSLGLLPQPRAFGPSRRSRVPESSLCVLLGGDSRGKGSNSRC